MWGLLLTSVGCDNDVRTILVQTQPAGAKVFINGKLAGASPCKVQWTDKRPDDLWELHVIEVRADGYPPQRKEIRYRTGAAWLPERIELTLSPMDTASSDGTSEGRNLVWTPQKESSTADESAVKPSPDAKPRKKKIKAKSPPKSDPPGGKPKSASASKSKSKPKNKPEPRIPDTQPAASKTSEPSFSIWRPKGRVTESSTEPESSDAPQRPDPTAPQADPSEEPADSAPAKVSRQTVILARGNDVPKSPDHRSRSAPAERLLACEIRLVRLSDGRVLSQVSLQAPYPRREKMADVLVKLLARDAPDDATVAVGCLSNRRETPEGKVLCEDMTRATVRAVRQTPGLRYVGRVNLRDVILDEKMIESPKIVSDRRIAHLFAGAEHVIVGGAAMAIPISETPRPAEEDETLYDQP